ncbi:hypothetical protein O6H91_Y180100 [Diphasiastrum complanatum]|nr:hypothetical protein O6H91_Y180100 [Diphasiastrum complanatum]
MHLCGQYQTASSSDEGSLCTVIPRIYLVKVKRRHSWVQELRMSAHKSVKKGQLGRLDNRNPATELSNSNGENAWPSKVSVHQPEEEKMVDPGLPLQAFPLKEDDERPGNRR